jgi:hypothetical protein
LQLQPFANYVDRQVSLKGPAVVLGPEATQALGLAFHELANNAKRFGALSVPEGRISVTWSRLAHPGGYSVEVKWVESGGPAVAAPVARRFGSVVIERNLERAIAGKVNLAFLAGGVQCDILIPPEHLVARRCPDWMSGEAIRFPLASDATRDVRRSYPFECRKPATERPGCSDVALAERRQGASR